MADYYDQFCNHCTDDAEANRAAYRREEATKREYRKTPQYVEDQRLREIAISKAEVKRLKAKIKKLKEQ